MPWPKAMPIVEVEWVDSNAEGGWSSVEKYRASAIDTSTVLCRSTGYLLHKDRQRLMLVQSQSQKSGNVSDAITIPRFAVKSIRTLAPAEKGK